MNDVLFHQIDDAFVILHAKGVYRQTPLFRKTVDGEERLFAKHGSGFIGLCGSKGTTVPTVTWVEMETRGDVVHQGRLGRPVYREPGR